METEKVNPQIMKQNLYAVKTLWQLNPRRVIHEAVNISVDYLLWLFGSIFFLRYIIHAKN